MSADTTTPASTAIDVRTISWIRPLVGAYAYDYDSVAPLYAGNPATRDAWADAARRAQSYRRDHAAIAQIVAAQQERRGAPPEARAAAARLAGPNAVAVATGQQAGVFGGPLFTLLKADQRACSSRSARATSSASTSSPSSGSTRKITTGRRSGADGPRFGVPAEDHHARRSRRRRRAAHCVADARRTHRTALVRSSSARWRRRISRHGSGTSPAPPIGRALGMAEAFARWIEAVLGPHGLVVFDSTDAGAKRLVVVDFRPRARHARDGRRRWPRTPRTRSPRAAMSHRSCRSATACRCFT